jgi:transcriptional regulator GlxA family with amidase domain
MTERTVGVVLFPGFELLDVFGPLEAFGNLPGMFRVVLVAEQAGPVASAQGPRAVADHGFGDCPRLDVVLVPGGIGTREEAENPALLGWLGGRAAEAEVVTSVCTGAALLARAGVLDGRRATTNKAFFQWVADQGPNVEWVREARWVEDGKFATSSGVSAGIDMALAVIARLVGREVSENVARAMEYEWHTDATWDPFAKAWGLV